MIRDHFLERNVEYRFKVHINKNVTCEKTKLTDVEINMLRLDLSGYMVLLLF